MTQIIIIKNRFKRGPTPHHVHVFSHTYDLCVPRSHFC